MKLVKLLSAWFGPKPAWYGRFAEQMGRFATADWECVPPAGVPEDLQEGTNWMNELGTRVLGTRCRKGGGKNNACDFRPAYGELFSERYEGYPWWGWCDLDLRFGDLDEILPRILTDEWDAVSFKKPYLSGCFAMFRNTPQMKSLFRTGPYRQILGDHHYHCWDESGYHHLPGESFFNLMLRAGVRIHYCPELYSYDSPSEKARRVEAEGGKLYSSQEVLFHHFMSDQWPEG